MNFCRTPISPRIQTLKREIESGRTAALAEFWQEMMRQGTPLVEPFIGQNTLRLVTFLWRGTPDLHNVVVLDGIAGEDFIANQLTHLPDTDVWYKTFLARSDVHTVYSFSPNDPLLAEGEAGWVEHFVSGFVLDPLNPHTLFDEASILRLPDAPPEPWITTRPESPIGEITKHQFHSEILGNERTVWIYAPPSYTPNSGPYGWLLLFDGGYYLSMPVATILDNLLADGLIPPLIGILVGNAEGMRTHELTCNPRLCDCITQELLPWVRSQYQLSNDPSQTVIGGFSYGGLTATYTALCHNEIFGNVLSQSGCFWWMPGYDDKLVVPVEAEYGWIIRQFVKAPRLRLHFHLDVGRLETSNKPGGVHANILIANRHLRDVLEAKGHPVHYVEVSGGHDLIGWRIAFPDALVALIGNVHKC